MLLKYFSLALISNLLGISLLAATKSTVTTTATTAAPARARWIDSAHIVLKLPPGLPNFGGMHFILANSLSPSATDVSSYELPLLNSSDGRVTLSTAQLTPDIIDRVIQRPLRVFTTNAQNQVLDSTGIQYAGLLDEMYFYNGNDLGVIPSGGQIQVKIWAPTAQQIKIRLYQNSSATDADAILPLERTKGVWQATLPSSFLHSFYLYEVEVYQPLTDKVETSLVTDPYSRGLAVNAVKSQILDPDATEAQPSGWRSLAKPSLNSLKDSVVYELHIRDFSAGDESIPENLRGTYLAFTQTQSSGMRELQSLAKAGLTHVHLLPFNDFGSVNEDKSTWQNYRGDNGHLEEPQSIIARQRTTDAYNWGYDPAHYFTPEGSYAVQAEGPSRLLEVRTMVAALNKIGLRVVQDVVFNHTFQNGLVAGSVFDKIVPLYYYRLNEDGDTYNSSCCADTATEHRMMEKLMVDSVLYWARTFKLDGFRFDLMSFHSHETMVKLREAVRSLTLGNDGVDGSKILLYGEGWNYGSLYDQSPRDAMTIGNSFGLGFGFFNDRLRDAVRGGTTHGDEKSDQGFATGLFSDFNQEPANRDTPPDLGQQSDKLLQLGDVIKAGLAANLRDFSFREYRGSNRRVGDLKFRGESVGNAAQAIETINYVSAHDGYTLWDAIQAKAPFYTASRSPRLADLNDRQRMHQLAMAIPLLSQGIPFMEAGTEILRSKNGDQDSYDSGDFFNFLEWTLQSDRWGLGLPPAWRNLDDWSFWQPRLQDPALKVGSDLITRNRNYILALLRLRQSTPLFKMNTLDDISRGLSFIDNESHAEAGLIAMSLKNSSQTLLIFFNGARNSRTFSNSVLQKNWSLHPLLNTDVDPALSSVVLDPKNSSIQIPGYSTVVLTLGSKNSSGIKR